ncbi:anti-sigma factor domain-containing protein [Streptomyces sp. VRA16 Mangrove soil]|uniref:anti-sigma factor n=1 Tax=Streptomyces sp. VRA16 Mangrove soil TaxID=2817434 RepID=UPI001A9EC9E7|nr:anti-sigma factor [Streptomyces sp. VRA16 Mangrove soil]MBO1331941.1 anti-sigma factor [Streptomyces sp. VRA16 Mangrove soil]
MRRLPRWLTAWPLRDVHSLAVPYALDALDPPELARFERHLRHCERCTAEVQAHAVDTLRLARAARVPAPPGLRDRVLSAVRTLEQEPAPPPGAAPAARRPLLVPLAAGAAVLALIAAVLLGVELTRTQDRLDARQAEAREIAHVLAAPDARAVRGDGIAVVASSRRHSAVITVTDLAPPPRGRDHQLWVLPKGSGPPRSLGVLPDSGSDTPLLATGLTSDASSLAVTTEPDGGSRHPTSAPLVQLALKSVGFGE